MFHVGDAARKVRKSLKMTLQEVSELTGLRPNTISEFEQGKKTAEIATLEAIAAALGTTPGQIYMQLEGGIQKPAEARARDGPKVVTERKLAKR